MKTKETITQIVRDYTLLDPSEFEALKSLTRAKRSENRTKFGEVQVDTDMRSMVELPETLFGMLKTRLLPEEFKWLRCKTGTRWFATSFKDFSLTDKV